MLRALHIMQFEKYVSNAIRLWDTMGVENRYVSIWAPTDSMYCELIDRIEYIKEEELINIIQTGVTYDVVVFESLPTSLYSLILKIPSNKVIIWQSVGCDIYYEDYPYRAIVPIKIYKPKTRKYALSEFQYQHPKGTILKQLYFKIAQIVHFQRTYRRRKIKKEEESQQRFLQSQALKRVNYISTVLDMEYDLIRRNKDIRAKFFHFKYIGSPVDLNYYKIINFSKTKFILLGNSSDASNNHLDILEILKQRKITTPIYTPLAYAGTGDYPQIVAEKIAQNEQNIVQKDFVSKNRYEEIVQYVRVGVFGHMRQQALGNITAMLLQGSKVFLYKDSIAYAHFKRQGAYIYTIENDLTQKNIDTPLSPEQIAYNRNLFANDYDNITKAMRKDLIAIESEIENVKMKTG